MVRKTFAIFLGLLSVAIFGGIGGLCAYIVGASLVESWRSDDWVKTRADVVGTDITIAGPARSQPGAVNGLYRYQVGTTTYTGARLGTLAVGGADPFDDWDDDMRTFLASAASEKRKITVAVDPDDPTHSLIDTEPRWMMLGLLMPFALCFTLIGLGSLYGVGKAFATPPENFALRRYLTKPWGLWVFAVIWNLVSWPVSAAAIPSAIADGEWGVWFVLLFPFVGLLIAWGAIGNAMKFHQQRAASEVELQAEPKKRPPARPAKPRKSPGEV